MIGTVIGVAMFIILFASLVVKCGMDVVIEGIFIIAWIYIAAYLVR